MEQEEQLVQVEKILDIARPALEMHGGGIRISELTEDGTLRVVLQGHCVGCPLSIHTMRLGIERLLFEHIPHIVKTVEEV